MVIKANSQPLQERKFAMKPDIVRAALAASLITLYGSSAYAGDWAALSDQRFARTNNGGAGI
jgi:hypothetical protein